MSRDYTFHYDINFDTEIKEGEREDFHKSLVGFLRPHCKDQNIRVRKHKKFSVHLGKKPNITGLATYEHLHFRATLESPTKEIIDQSNKLSNKITGFIGTLPNRTIKSVELEVDVEVDITKSLVLTLTNLSYVRDLSSKLRMNIKPVAVAFETKLSGAELLATFVSGRKERLLLAAKKKLRDAPWDIIATTRTELDTYIGNLLKALGVK